MPVLSILQYAMDRLVSIVHEFVDVMGCVVHGGVVLEAGKLLLGCCFR